MFAMTDLHHHYAAIQAYLAAIENLSRVSTAEVVDKPAEAGIIKLWEGDRLIDQSKFVGKGIYEVLTNWKRKYDSYVYRYYYTIEKV
jgi:hypothetical protein